MQHTKMREISLSNFSPSFLCIFPFWVIPQAPFPFKDLGKGHLKKEAYTLERQNLYLYPLLCYVI